MTFFFTRDSDETFSKINDKTLIDEGMYLFRQGRDVLISLIALSFDLYVQYN